MKKLMICFVMGILISLGFVMAASSDFTYVLSLDNDNGTLSVSSLELFDSPFNEFSNSDEGRYRVELVNKKEVVLHSVRFDIESWILPMPSPECFDEESGEMICDIGPISQDVEFVILNLPYFDSASGINVYRGDELLLSHGIVNLEASEFDIWDYKYYIMGLIVLIVVVLYFIFRRKSQPAANNIPLARGYG
jgi:hypothetical protein